MGLENILTYTKLDPGPYFIVTANKVERASKPRTVDAWIYDDKGVAHFPANTGWTHRWNGLIATTGTSNNSSFHPWGLTQTGDIDDWWGLLTGGKSILSSFFTLEGGVFKIKINEIDSGSSAAAEYIISADTRYWLEVEYDPDIGTFGTLYLRIFLDAYISHLATRSLTLRSSKKAYDNIFPAMSVNTGAAAIVTGEAQDLDLMEVVGVTGRRRRMLQEIH